MQARLSIIIPFGLSKQRPYIKDRVLQKVRDFTSGESVEYIFVEGFSSELAPEIQALIKESGHTYLKDEAQQERGFFSQGACRNLGVKNAKFEVVMALDVDYYLTSANLAKILKLIELKDFANNQNALIVLPCVFLKEEANALLPTKKEEEFELIIQNDLISGKNELVKFFTPVSTSSFAINKELFLRLGGFDEDFVGHGYEDFDLLARVLLKTQAFEKMPRAMLYDSRNWDFSEFKGFRAYFSLLGYECCFYGLYLYHFWHSEPNQNGYFDNKDKNHKRFFSKLQGYLQEELPENRQFHPLSSFIYKPYLYELSHKGFSFLPQNLQTRISHTKFYRLFRKFKSSPQAFFKDSKNPLLKFIAKLWA
ncbi:galactosyltransferase-related protein [Campylobacter troglodytis]|uniref:galactosyltransferase-related protein n=1 Tax=Campylobacter troglodytis TaxID=654363 RepID=UPI00115A8414|nr:galactosyltransferase-related protein [Campylobacter troglodytis]TQR58598.1 hypothetical protein DMC01_07715 [Campylobacter troglodytis]